MAEKYVLTGKESGLPYSLKASGINLIREIEAMKKKGEGADGSKG